MLILLLANKINVEEPSNILYAAAVEFLILDSFIIGFIVRIVIG